MTEHLIQFTASDSAGTSFTALIRTHSKWNQILHFSGQIMYCLTVSTIYEVLIWQIKHTYRGAGVNALLQGLDFLLLGLVFLFLPTGTSNVSDELVDMSFKKYFC